MSYFYAWLLRNTLPGRQASLPGNFSPDACSMNIQKKFLLLFGLPFLLASCATGTIAQLKDVKVDLKDEKIDGGLDKAMQSYQVYLDKAPVAGMTPDAILRLADLEIQKEYDFQERSAEGEKVRVKQSVPASKDELSDFEKRATSISESSNASKPRLGKAGADTPSAGTQEAISLYRKLLNEYPGYENNDHALYQLARIYEELGNTDEAINMMDRLVKDYPHSRYIEEVQFRRGEYNYARKKFSAARDAYQAIVGIGARSSYYELALYKLGWTYYKQEQYEGAIHQFIVLLDYKISTGYDLDHPKSSFDEKRIDDTFRVMSLGFSYLGGGDSVADYFNKYGMRAYENNVYKNLGDYYLEKRRYSDAALTFKAFVNKHPDHKLAPYFGMWSIDSYKKGDFPKLVIESDKEFVTNFGLNSAFWKHLNITVPNDVSAYINTSLQELANYYHAQFRDKRLAADKDKNFQEALKWYREYSSSFPKDKSEPNMHYHLAELLLENKWYGQAAIEFEHIAYDYPAHDRSAAAGYAAVYALRENLATVAHDEGDHLKRDVIRSSLKFAETFPRSEKAPLVLGAAADDIYALKDYPLAASTARKLLAQYSSAEQPIRRAAWVVLAHSSFELKNFKDAEEGYLSALGLTAQNDPSRESLIENLAVSFYKQGELALKREDYRTASRYFQLIDTETPTAKIRPSADFDSALALMQLKDWNGANKVISSFRANFPGHPLIPELSKKLAFAYKEAGELLLAAAEYENVAAETKDMTVRKEALWAAGDLYAQGKSMDKAYPVYLRYVNEFPKPLEPALEIRHKIAIYVKTRDNLKDYLTELKLIMDEDASAGPERTSRTRYLGAAASLEFAEIAMRKFATIKIEQPFEENLALKKDAMKLVKEQLDKLFSYEIDEFAAAGTYYLAEMYYDFNRKLVESERPGDLSALEKEQYELSIEEQAYPFEEKAIQIHQKNLELMTRGIFNSWIEKSMDKLGKLVPARYAKYEESSGFIEAIDTVSYPELVNPKPVILKTSPGVVAPSAGIAPVRGASPELNPVSTGK